jgi:hypothetical protein
MATKKEKEWYKKFMDGTFVVKGWKSREKELLEDCATSLIMTQF